MKKRILSFLLVVALGLSLCACHGPATTNPGGDSGNPDSESGGENNPLMFEIPEGGYDGSEVTITFYHTLSSGYWSLLDTYIAEFNKLYPNIEVIAESVGDEEDVYAMTTTLKDSGNGPNIVMCRPDIIGKLRAEQCVIALDNLIADSELGLSQAQKDDFIAAFYNQGKEYGDGDMYSLPFSKKAEVLFYNKVFFEQHKLKVPTTWEEMEAVCEQIKTINPSSTPLEYEDLPAWFITMSQQLGTEYISIAGDYTLFDNEKNRSFANDIEEWFNKEYVVASMFTGEDCFWGTVDQTSYMIIADTTMARHLLNMNQMLGVELFEIGIATVPQYDVNNPKVYAEGPDLCILKKENPQEMIASWLFVKFLTTSKEFQSAYSLQSGYMPVLKSVAEMPEYAQRLAEANGKEKLEMLAIKSCLEQQNSYFTLPALEKSKDVYSAVGGIIEEILDGLGEHDIDSLFENAANKLK